MYFDLRHRERIKLLYSNDGMEQFLKNIQEVHPHYTLNDFILAESRPSFNRLIENLRKAEMEKFWELDKEQYEINTIYPGLGFKTPYRDRKVGGYVYVLDMGSWADRPQRVIDESRERACIYIGNYEKDWGGHRGLPQEYMHYAYFRANRRYVDRLTKKQREAVMFIKMLPEGEFVVGLGGWKQEIGRAHV